MTQEKEDKLKNMIVLLLERAEPKPLTSKYSQVCLVLNIQHTQLLDGRQNLTCFHTEPALFWQPAKIGEEKNKAPPYQWDIQFCCHASEEETGSIAIFCEQKYFNFLSVVNSFFRFSLFC